MDNLREHTGKGYHTREEKKRHRDGDDDHREQKRPEPNPAFVRRADGHLPARRCSPTISGRRVPQRAARRVSRALRFKKRFGPHEHTDDVATSTRRAIMTTTTRKRQRRLQ